MAATSRALTLKLLADISDFTKGIDQSSKRVDTMGDKIKKFGKAAAAGLLVAGAAAVAFGRKAIAAGEAAATSNARIDQINKSMGLFGDSTDSVTASLVDYANTVARSTGIDQNAIKATQAKLLTFKEIAITADELGGNFERATKAAIDLGAAGFGTAETNAVQLGKALNDPIKGITALTRSGVTFTESEKERIKVLVESNKVSEAQNMILTAIETQVGGTAEATSNATDRMKVGLSQVTENIGLHLLPIFEKLTEFILNNIVPAVQGFVAGLTGDKGVKNSLEETQSGAIRFGEKVLGLIKTIIRFKDEIKILGTVLLSVFVVGKVAAFATSMIAAIRLIVAAMNALRTASVLAGIAGYFALNPLAGLLVGAATIAGIAGFAALSRKSDVKIEARADGGPVFANKPYMVGERGPELFVPKGSGSIIPNGMGGGTTINLTVNGAIDSESTARQIVSILNDSQARGTLGSAAFA